MIRISPLTEQRLNEFRDYALETAAADGKWPLNAADDCLRMRIGQATFLFQHRPESTDLVVHVLNEDYSTALTGVWRFRSGFDRLSVWFLGPDAEAFLGALVPSYQRTPRETLH
jgi:hypothetical protein